MKIAAFPHNMRAYDTTLCNNFTLKVSLVFQGNLSRRTKLRIPRKVINVTKENVGYANHACGSPMSGLSIGFYSTFKIKIEKEMVIANTTKPKNA